MKLKYKGNWHNVTNVTQDPTGKDNIYWLSDGGYVLSNEIEGTDYSDNYNRKLAK